MSTSTRRQRSLFACWHSVVCGKNAGTHNPIGLGMCGGGGGLVKVRLYSNFVCLWASLLVQSTLSSSTYTPYFLSQQKHVRVAFVCTCSMYIRRHIHM